MDRKAGTSLFLVALAALIALAAPVAANGLVGGRAALSTPVPAGPVTAWSATLAGGPDKADLAFDLSAPVAPTAYVLADPDRVIVDLPETNFLAAPSAAKPGRNHRHQADLVASYRFGLVAPGRSRIVVDLAAPARIVSAAIVQKAGRFRLVVSLAHTDAASFHAAPRAPMRSSPPPRRRPRRRSPRPASPPSSSTPAMADRTPARWSMA